MSYHDETSIGDLIIPTVTPQPHVQLHCTMPLTWSLIVFIGFMAYLALFTVIIIVQGINRVFFQERRHKVIGVWNQSSREPLVTTRRRFGDERIIIRRSQPKWGFLVVSGITDPSMLPITEGRQHSIPQIKRNGPVLEMTCHEFLEN